MASRTRSQVDVPPTYGYFQRTYSVGNDQLTWGPFLEAYDNRTMTDTLTPDYKRRVANGETIINPMTFSRTSRDSVGLGIQTQTTWDPWGTPVYQYTGEGNLTLLFEPYVVYQHASVDVGPLIEDAKLMALSGIDSTPLSSGEDLLELKETLNFLKSPIKGILKEAKKRNITRFVDVPAATWLTYRFAFAPLVRSIHDILSEMREPTKTPADIRVSHGRAQARDKVSSAPQLANSLGGYHQFGSNSSVESEVHAFIRYRLKTATHDWRWRYGLRNKDIPASYWAVVPLSFMVDRVFDVSSMVKAVTNLADPNVQILGAGTSIKQTTVFQRWLESATCNSVAYRTNYSAVGPNVIDTSFSMYRQPYSPSLRDVVPRIKPKGLVEDFTKTTDLAALLRMFTRK